MSSTEIDEERLHATTDASVWAEEFCKRFHVYDHIADYWVDDEEGLMIGWFANAIETAKMAQAKASVVERDRLRAALVTLHRYDDGLRASNWGGLANVIKEALDA